MWNMRANKAGAKLAKEAFKRLARIYLPPSIAENSSDEHFGDFRCVTEFFNVAEAALPNEERPKSVASPFGRKKKSLDKK